MCRSQIPVCALNVFSLFSNAAVHRESTCIENRLSLIDQSNLCNTWGKKGEGEEGKKEHIKVSPSTNNKYQTTGENVKRQGDFWCACVSAEIKVDGTRDEGKGRWRVWRKAEQRKVKGEKGKRKDEVRFIWLRLFSLSIG